jgi:hypothetical protein
VVEVFFSGVLKKLGEKKAAQLIGVAEIGMGALIAAKPLAPRASALGRLQRLGSREDGCPQKHGVLEQELPHHGQLGFPVVRPMFSAPVTWGPVGQRAGGGEALEPAR